MPANNALVVSGLSFDTIRSNLRDFIASKPDFADYDFNDSAMGTLLDLLAYNTYYTSFYVNMAVNESFLDSAQIRDSIVSRAKMLGYLPRSARGAVANVKVTFGNSVVSNGTFTTITIPKNTQFTSSIDGSSYTFVTPQSYLVEANSSNRFQRYIDIVEGVPITDIYAMTAANTQFVLPNERVDVRSVQVQVTTSGNTQNYVMANDLRTINSSSRVFFVEADRNNLYKVLFGDNVTGKRPDTGSAIRISYRVCNGIAGNGANTFTAVGLVGGQSSYTLQTAERAAGGVEPESDDSIKFNAPRAYEVQNRAVTATDYESIILRDNTDVAAVSVWGGEENDPPIYGKVYVCAKPVSGSVLSSARKEAIRYGVKKYNVVSIDTEFVDPSYLYIVPTITVKYNSNETTRTASEIASLVANRIVSFERNNLNNFNGKFWYSRFLNYIDGADQAIVGSSAVIDLQKRFVPLLTAPNTYILNYDTQLQRLGEAESLSAVRGGASRHPGFGYISSTAFTYTGFTSYLEDNGFGIVRVYYRDSDAGRIGRVYTNYGAGNVDYSTGKLTLNSFLPTAYSGNHIRVNVRPEQPNIEPVRNQILLISDVKIAVIEENSGVVAARVDSVATIGSSAAFENPTTAIPSVTTF